MKKLLLIVVAGVALLLAVACSEVEELQSSLEQNELVDEGSEAYLEKDFQLALQKWEAAYALEENDEVAFSLAECQAQLGNSAEAMVWLREGIRLSLGPHLESKELAPLAEEVEFMALVGGYQAAVSQTSLTKMIEDGGISEGVSAWDKYMAGDYLEAAELNIDAFKHDQTNDLVAFNAACNYSLLGELDLAMEWLIRSFKVYCHKRLEDQDLDPLRHLAEFKGLNAAANSIWE